MSLHALRPFAPFVLSSCWLLTSSVQAATQDTTPAALELENTNVVATALEETKQMPGVSIITAEDIKKRPPANDLSQIIRTMPGVNLTGNSTSGQRPRQQRQKRQCHPQLIELTGLNSGALKTGQGLKPHLLGI